MKTILSTILLLLALNASAQQYIYRPTGFTDTFVRTIVNAAQARAYFGISYDSTNSPTLNGTNVFTGTNTFPAASFYPANMIGQRVLWASPTNIFIASVVTNATANATNNGDYANTTHLGYGVIPPLLSSNSIIVLQYITLRTNANATGAIMYFYIGENTNFTGSAQIVSTAAAQGVSTGQAILMPGGSMTNWIQGTSYATPLRSGPYPFFDGTVSNQVFMGLTTQTTCTNAIFYAFRLVEFYGP